MKKKYIKKIILLCALVIGNLSCTSWLKIERLEDFSLKTVEVKQVVSINPTFKVLTQEAGKKMEANSYSEMIRKEQLFNTLLENNAKKNDIVLQIIDTDKLENNDAAFFNYLAPLRKEILQVNYLQDFKHTTVEQTNKRQIKYSKGPRISTHYSHLAEIYGTPYFAVQGISYHKKVKSSQSESILSATEELLPSLTTDNKTMFFTVIADVSTSQIVYREYREISANASQSNLNSIIYDSFKMIVN